MYWPNIWYFQTSEKKKCVKEKYSSNQWISWLCMKFSAYLTNGTHLMVTDSTTAIIPKPQHRACISLGFFSQLQDTMLQFGKATSTLTMLDRKSRVQPPVPMAMASQMDKSGTRPRICKPRDIVSRTWASLDNLIPLSTLTLKMQKMIDMSWIALLLQRVIKILCRK